MELSAFETAYNEGAVMQLKDPAEKRVLMQDAVEGEDPKPITIRLAGSRSSRWMKASDVVGNKTLSTKEQRSVEEFRIDRATILAAVTLGWEGVKVDGELLSCSAENARKLYLRFTWILDQVDRFVGNQENFLPASSTS